MASMNDRLRRNMAHYSGVAMGAAPVVRRLASDPQLREDARELLSLGGSLAQRVSKEKGRRAQAVLTDAESSAQLARFMDAFEDAARRLRSAAEAEQRRWRRRAIMIGALAGGLAALIAVPRSAPMVRDKVVSIVRPKDAHEHEQMAA